MPLVWTLPPQHQIFHFKDLFLLCRSTIWLTHTWHITSRRGKYLNALCLKVFPILIHWKLHLNSRDTKSPAEGNYHWIFIAFPSGSCSSDTEAHTTWCENTMHSRGQRQVQLSAACLHLGELQTNPLLLPLLWFAHNRVSALFLGLLCFTTRREWRLVVLSDLLCPIAPPRTARGWAIKSWDCSASKIR